MIYYFCGHRGCGKNFLANQISKSIPIEIIDTGPIIREAYAKYNSDNISFKDWMINNEEKYGKDFSNIIICRMTKIEKEKNYIIIGFRSIDGIQYFNNNFKITDYQIHFIDGEHELFRKNYNTREETNISEEEYKKIIKVEETMGIKKIKEVVLDNKDIGKYYYKNQNDNSIYEEVLKNIKRIELEEER